MSLARELGKTLVEVEGLTLREQRYWMAYFKRENAKQNG